MVVAKNRRNALSNHLAMNGGNVEFNGENRSPVLSHPLTSEDIAPVADGAAVVVVASGKVAKALRDDPVWIGGFGWASDSPTLKTPKLD